MRQWVAGQVILAPRDVIGRVYFAVVIEISQESRQRWRHNTLFVGKEIDVDRSGGGAGGQTQTEGRAGAEFVLSDKDNIERLRSERAVHIHVHLMRITI